MLCTGGVYSSSVAFEVELGFRSQMAKNGTLIVLLLFATSPMKYSAPKIMIYFSWILLLKHFIIVRVDPAKHFHVFSLDPTEVGGYVHYC